MSDFTIIIPHRGSVLGLWATITSCEEDLLDTRFTYNYVIVVNGEKENSNSDLKTLRVHLATSGKLKDWVHIVDNLPPPAARELGVAHADGKYLFFFDNHCLVSKGYFNRAMFDFDKYGMDVLHSTTQYYGGGPKCYHYTLCLERNFWAESCDQPHANNILKPYPMAVGGHGGFAVKSDSWREVGGYGPPGLFKGYGGEEVYFDMKMWMLGKSVWIDPLVLHYHYAGERGYKRHYTDEFYVNLMVCANVIGGRKWMNKVFESFSTKGRFIKYLSGKTMFELLMEADERSTPHSKELDKLRHKDLDTLLMWMQANDIPL